MKAGDALNIGDRLTPLTKGPITRQHLVEWCAAENDYYPLHYDERVAARMGLEATPIQGTYKVALIGQLLARILPAASRIVSIDISYRGSDFEGDTLTVNAKLVDRVSQGSQCERLVFDVWTENQRGEPSTTGRSVVECPSS